MSAPDPIEAIGALADGTRLRIYRYISDRREAVSREEVSKALEIPLSKAKFHLDRLAKESVLEIEYRRMTGKQGPGAGRPAKLYRRAGAEIRLSLPERRYDIMGDILATAIERAQGGVDIESAIAESAYSTGIAAARTRTVVAEPAAAAPEATDTLERANTALSALGYEADVEVDALCLHNCPFDAMAQQHRNLACGANKHFVQGVLDGSGCDGLHASLEPTAGRCCVVARRSTEPSSPSS